MQKQKALLFSWHKWKDFPIEFAFKEGIGHAQVEKPERKHYIHQKKIKDLKWDLLVDTEFKWHITHKAPVTSNGRKKKQ